jgi:DegV family protein with EDD domain
VVTDSTACIPPELAARHDIEVLPLHLAFADRDYQDGITEDASEFYELLRAAKEPPTTSAPSPGVYAETFLRLGADGDSVVCVTVSRQFSAIYDAASQGASIAREQAPALDVRVLDSTAATMAQGFVALEAARTAQKGGTIEQVVARAEALMPRVQLLVALDTLTYLGRSGRVPRLLIWASSPLQLRPIVEFKKGVYRPIGIARTKHGAERRLLQALDQRAAGAKLHLAVHHTNALEEATSLAERARAQCSPQELHMMEFSQAMGVHTGPGLLGFAFYTEET